MQLREKLPLLMEEHRFGATDLARAAGVSESQVYAWISQRPVDANRKPTFEQLLGVARLFGKSMESLADPEMMPSDNALPHDEQTVLDTYRHLKMTTGLKAAEASVRMTGPTPPFEGKSPS